MKKRLILLLALALAFTLTVCAAAQADDVFPLPANPTASPAASLPPEADAQIQLLYARFDDCKQDESNGKWSYIVTDLDHDGQLELLAANIQGAGRFTTVKGWEVKPGNQELEELSVPVAQGDSFPDIVTDAADTYHDQSTGVWYYMFHDQIVVSTAEAYNNKAAIALSNGTLQFCTYAYQHNEWIDGRMVTTFTDRDGNIIRPEEFNAVGTNVFAGMERSATRFDWFLAPALKSAARLADSYAVFSGLKQPAPATPAPTMTPRPDTPSSFLIITKSPTSEYHNAGETAWFVANADNWNAISWTFVSPDGGEYSWQSFASRFYDASISGVNSTSLCVANVSEGMDGWGVYATFYGGGQTARTSTAYFTVYARPTPRPTPVPTLGPLYGQMDGSVSDFDDDTVTIALDNGSSVQLSQDICSISGNLDYGCSATVYYQNYPREDYIYSCTIQGNDDPPEPWVGPVFGQMNGYVSDFQWNTVTITLDNGSSVQLSQDICSISGNLDYGCFATVYYQNYPREDYIYSCEIQGNDDPPTPVSGSIGGSYSGDDGDTYYFHLDNDLFVSVSGYLVSCYGVPQQGDPCTAYYSGGDCSGDTIYHVDVYGRLYDEHATGLIVPDDPDEPDDPDDPDYPDHPIVYDPEIGLSADWDEDSAFGLLFGNS